MHKKLTLAVCFSPALFSNAYAQVLQVQEPLAIWWYLLIFLLVLGAIGSLIWVIALRTDERKISLPSDHRKRKETGFTVKPQAKEFGKPQIREIKFSGEAVNTGTINPGTRKTKQVAFDIDPTKFLPVFLLDKLPEPSPFTPLPISNDEGLLSAVEQIHSGEDDEEARALAVKILAAMRTQNSVNALSKVALYDSSEELKIEAIRALASFNHESVFEPILLACADRSKRVKVASIQALSQLSVDRTQGWLRMLWNDDEDKVRWAARAVIESGFADRVFERLIVTDRKVALEAVSIVALLIKGEETPIIFRHLLEGENLLVKKAILHILKISRSKTVLNGLYMLLEKQEISEDLRKQIDETIEAIGFTTE